MSRSIRHSLGPSIIITASVVGTGELIVAPRLGASVGLTALWLIVLGCVVKVFLQEELGRHTILTGDTTLTAFNRVPGPRWRLSWAGWCCVLLAISGTVQMGGILVSMVQTLHLLHLPGPVWLLALALSAGTAFVLILGRYGLVETTSSLLVAAFTGATVIALFLLQRTEYAVSLDSVLNGLTFRLPESGFGDAVAVFGITGIGCSELMFYPYWCLEKGYARDLKPGVPRDPSVLAQRLRGMRLDIVVALVVYTFATIAFFVLGATVLHGAQEVPRGTDMIHTLSQMYTRTFGEWMYYVFVVGAFIVLYSTFFVCMATWGRLFADVFGLVYRGPLIADRRRLIKWTIAGLGVVYLLLCLGFSRTPQWLIVGGGAVQTLLLPVLGAGVLAIRKQRAEINPPGRGLNAALYLSMAIITVAAIYSVWRLLRG
jgi:Mn2+/Fe2+ NRAMP family transporter